MSGRLVKDPDVSHTTDMEEVYAPASDSFLLMAAMDEGIKKWVEEMGRKDVLFAEIGPGSGIITAHASRLLRFHCIPHHGIAVDLNLAAVEASRQTMAVNHAAVDVVASNMIRARPVFDLVLFNPPYVPSPAMECNRCDIRAAWAGGVDGREVTDALIALLPTFIAPRCTVIMVLIAKNKPNEVAALMKEHGFTSAILKQRKVPGEKLYIYKFSRLTVYHGLSQ